MDVKKLFSFEGRIGRGAFWGIGIANALVGGVFYAIAMNANNGFFTFLAVVVFLVSAVIGLATSVKRWHDRDKSWAWIFIAFIPLVGGIWAFVEQGCLSGTDGPNQYGVADSGSPFADEAVPYDATAIAPQQKEWGR